MERHIRFLVRHCADCRIKSLTLKTKESRNKYYKEWLDTFHSLPSQYVAEYERVYLKRIENL